MARRANGEGSIYYQEKQGRWCAQITLHLDPGTGKPVRRSVYGKTQAEVRAKLDQLKRLRAENALNTPSRMTVEQWAAEWLKHTEQHVRPKTHEGYERWVRVYINPYLGKVKLEKLTGRDIQMVLDKQAAQYRPRVPQLTRVTLGMMLNYAVKLGVLPRSPVQSTRAPRVEQREMSIWTPEQVRTFLRHIRGHRLEALFYLAIATGMRKGELLGLRWSDIEPDRLHIRQAVAVVHGVIRVDAPKTRGSRRTVLLTPDITAHLNARRALWERERELAGEGWTGEDFVFCYPTGRAMSPYNLQTVWDELRGEVDLPRIRFHDLRHTYATFAIARGADVATLSERLGHADSSITLKVYTHVLDEQKRRLNLSMSDLLGDAEKNAASNDG